MKLIAASSRAKSGMRLATAYPRRNLAFEPTGPAPVYLAHTDGWHGSRATGKQFKDTGEYHDQ